MLATLSHRRFSDPSWLFELKFDGERRLAFRIGSSVKLFSRNQKPLNDSYPEIADPIAAPQLDNVVVDGEIVAFDGHVTSFARLLRRMQITDPAAARNTGKNPSANDQEMSTRAKRHVSWILRSIPATLPILKEPVIVLSPLAMCQIHLLIFRHSRGSRSAAASGHLGEVRTKRIHLMAA
jgi:hypothetical protein